jgi:predicted aspartyl protease
MPDFAYASPDLEALGPTVEISVRVSSALAKILMSQRRPVPPPVPITAVIDTGASWCLFTPDVYAKLQLEPHDVTTISTASAVSHSVNVYNVDVELLGVRVRNLHSLEAKLSGVPAEGLIGRNFLKRCIFVYDGLKNAYKLTL